MPDFYDVKNNGAGPILFGSESIEPGETGVLYLSDKQYQKFNALGWIVGVNTTAENAYSVSSRYSSAYVNRSSVTAAT